MHWIWSLVAGITAQRVRVRGPRHATALHLTFDDGPHPTVTPMLLDLLAQHQARATFFLLGRNVAQHPEIVERILREGHAIGNHSMTHANFRKASVGQQLREVRQADEAMSRIDGQRLHPFRPPHGHATVTTILNAVLRPQPLVLWNFDSEDYHLQGAPLVERLKRYQPQGGDILLFHDDMPHTVEALRTLLPIWRQAGLSLDALNGR